MTPTDGDKKALMRRDTGGGIPGHVDAAFRAAEAISLPIRFQVIG